MPGPESTPEEYNVLKFPKVIIVPWMKIEERGIVDLAKLYEDIWAWFVENKYITMEQKNESVDLPDGKEIKYEWQAYRKVDDYVRFWIYAQIWILRCVDVTIKENGQKVVKQKGDLDLRFHSLIEKDYENKFKRTKFGRFIRFIMDRYLIKKRLLNYRDKLRTETLDLYTQSKEILKELVT